MTEPSAQPIAEREKAIANLRYRAKMARRKLYWIIGLLLLALLAVAWISLSEAKTTAQQLSMQIFESRNGKFGTSRPSHGPPENAFAGKLSELVYRQIGSQSNDETKPNIVPQADYDRIDQEIDKSLEQYAKAAGVSSSLYRQQFSGPASWQSLLNVALIDIGAIAFGLLFIQIAMSFMRYYAQLAELYDAQADALVAAAGDQDRAAKFLDQFSPAIEFGKTPTTIYEKALEAVKEATIAAARNKAG